MAACRGKIGRLRFFEKCYRRMMGTNTSLSFPSGAILLHDGNDCRSFATISDGSIPISFTANVLHKSAQFSFPVFLPDSLTPR